MQSRLLKTKAARQVADAIMANDMFMQSELLVTKSSARKSTSTVGVARY